MERLHASAPLPRPAPAVPSGPAGRLALPEELTASLGCDAVGIPGDHGERIMSSLPRVGCVYADDHLWWWIVPSGSQLGVTWPPSTSYAVDACAGRHEGPERDAGRAGPSWSGAHPGCPALIHHPEGDSPYTPPIPLYFLACRLAGITPHWSAGAGV